MKNKKNIIIGCMCFMVAFMMVVFAALQTQLTIKGQGTVVGEWNIEITNIVSNNNNTTAYNIDEPDINGTNVIINTGLKKPGDKMTYAITVTNGGNIDAIIQDVIIVKDDNEHTIYTIRGLEQNASIPNSKSTTDNSVTFYLDVEFNEEMTFIPEDGSGEIEITIVCVQDDEQTLTPSVPSGDETTLLSNKILSNSNAQSGDGIDFVSSPRDTNGLYSVSTGTENDQTTYFYRGYVSNNYVQFGAYEAGTTVNGVTYSEKTPITWRIVRINEDGSIRLITVDSIGTTNYGAYGDNADIGYMYGSTGQNNYRDTHLNLNDSTVKDLIDNWYETHLKANYGGYLADAGFCNDRTKAPTENTWASDDTALGYGGFENNTYYGAYNRLNNTREVQFACPNSNDDLFTTGTGSKGNKALENPVGLITADEIIYASVVDDMASAILDYDTSTWTMTPARTGFVYLGSHWANINETERSADVRPVINLRSDVTVELTGTGDPGTITNPYIIKTN